ncbi:RelB [Companilactobacillus mishanensis]|uniref:RelB n=1 Tax=Companilactobacillus mishanensis TaxID=2486008 RepID=A0A5P0ZHV7_9LACO|nr:RelB [Companilactobacillus mishanensis]MQS45154.1 RelB [Companilactobacillus mishanensis]MQS52592.1 RelB [Companilactobacillus mishanensis]MQS89995.1 RelB [Companilactobacillus mishanensis]
MSSNKDYKVISIRVPNNILTAAKRNLTGHGASVSEYVRQSLSKAANNESELFSILKTTHVMGPNKSESLHSVNQWWEDQQ